MTTVITPTIRESARRSRFWIFAVIFAIIVAIVVMTATGASAPEGKLLSGTSASPIGSKAIVKVLQGQGVDVQVVATLDAARDATSGHDDVTLLLHDPEQYLDDDQLSEAAGFATHLVLIEPGIPQLLGLVPSIGAAGEISGKLEADCAVAAAIRARTILGDGSAYRLVKETPGTESCFESEDKSFSLIETTKGGSKITVLGAVAALTNEHVMEQGNAALALGVLGQHPKLVWYQPTVADVPGENAPTIAELTPAWLSPVLALMLLAVVAAGMWRGRRMGPLVVENLPVTVPSSETMEGRARLYQKSSARLHALDSLRIGTIARIANAAGVGRSADVTEVIAVASAISGIDSGTISHVLRDAVPQTDRDLIRLSDELLKVETAVTKAARQ